MKTERTMEWAMRVSQELFEGKTPSVDPAAEQRLRDKCRWEAMTRSAVLMEWGDPREWE